MTDKKRLIELLDKFGDGITFCDICDRPADDCEACKNDMLAEYLLEHGVLLLPCKVGDTVYKCVFSKNGKGYFVEYKVVGFHLGEFPNSRGQKRNEYLIIYHEVTDCIRHLNLKELGETVFLTREETEQALKERANNESL